MLELEYKGQKIGLGRPLVMGILNATPDSFFADSRVATLDKALEMAAKMVEQGADILDIGGQSTRPGAVQVSLQEEIDRVVALVERICIDFPSIMVSIDTYRSEVAAQALKAGAGIVNDISAGLFDDKMMDVVSYYNAIYVLMHIKGSPKDMQNDPQYFNVVNEVADFLAERSRLAKSKGIKQVVIDPGFGFGKTLAHNYQLLANTIAIKSKVELPMLVGVSRKSMIWRPLGITPEEALPATSALHWECLRQGADILRVHDVRECRQVVELYGLLNNH